jgi:hypothetical protein
VYQPRTQAQITKNMHTTVFLYRSVAKLSERAGVLGEDDQNNEMAAILVYGTGISSFLFKYFVLFHHPTGATDHVSENDL